MSLPILLGLGLWGSALNDSAKLAEEARKDRERERAIKEQEVADQKELRNVAAVQEPVIKEAADGMGPSAVMVGNKGAFGTEKEAQAFADQFNSPEARINRQRDALIGQGKATDGMNLEKGAIGLDSLRRTAARVLRDEGVNDFIDANFARMPSVEDVKAGKAKLFDLAGVDKYNAVGADKLPEGTKGRWKVMTLPNGRELVDFEAVDASGNSLTGPYSARVLQMLHNQSPVEREKTADTQFKEGREFGLRREQLDAQKAYWDKLGEAAETRADKAGSGKGAPEDRMTEPDRREFDIHRTSAQNIEREILRARASGEWAPEKNADQMALMQSRDKALRAAQSILARYQSDLPSDGTPGKSDPYGIRNQDSGGGTPQAGQGAGSERFQIIKAELSKTLARRDAAQPGTPEYVRASEDARALQAELSRLPKKERGALTSAGERPAAAPDAEAPAAAVWPADPRAVLPRPLTLREAQEIANQPPPSARKIDMRKQARATQGQGLRPEDLSVLPYLR